MNAVEIEEAISALSEQPFDAQEFPFAFLETFGNKPTTIKRLRSAIDPDHGDGVWAVWDRACSLFGALPAFVAGGARARPDHPISGSRSVTAHRGSIILNSK